MELIERYFVDKEYTDEDGNQSPPEKLSATVFKVTNISSDTLNVITNIPQMGNSPNLKVDLEKAVQALRIILRKRRYGEEQDPIIVEKPEEENNTEDNDEQNEENNQ